jgi:hypothetical protein
MMSTFLSCADFNCAEMINGAGQHHDGRKVSSLCAVGVANSLDMTAREERMVRGRGQGVAVKEALFLVK